MLIKDTYVWPFMEKEIHEWCRTCEGCQSSKVTRHKKLGFSFQVSVSGRFQALHVDILRPLFPSRQLSSFKSKARYLLTAIDCASMQIEVASICKISAETVAAASNQFSQHIDLQNQTCCCTRSFQVSKILQPATAAKNQSQLATTATNQSHQPTATQTGCRVQFPKQSTNYVIFCFALLFIRV